MTRSATQHRRVAYIVLALITIAIGLLVHVGARPGDARDVAGDALWAMMIVWWLSAIAPRAGLLTRSAAAYAVCVAVELSQRWQTPTLAAIRATRLGHLVLGSDFDTRDLLAYALGIGVAMALEALRRGPLRARGERSLSDAQSRRK